MYLIFIITGLRYSVFALGNSTYMYSPSATLRSAFSPAFLRISNPTKKSPKKINFFFNQKTFMPKLLRM
jgi:hypothetical protein